jgi:hypothetical protein
MGLIPLEATAGEALDAERHQIPDQEPLPSNGAAVGEVLATGYSYQGQIIRRSLVRVKSDAEASTGPAESSSSGFDPAAASSPMESSEEVSPPVVAENLVAAESLDRVPEVDDSEAAESLSRSSDELPLNVEPTPGRPIRKS